MSTDAILFYGFPVEEGDQNHELLLGADEEGEYPDDDFDTDKLWALKFGIDPEDYRSLCYHREKYPVLIGSHCSDGCPMHYIAVRKSEITANRGCPKKVKTFAVDPKWDDQIREFCTKFGLKPPKEFAWWVASDMG